MSDLIVGDRIRLTKYLCGNANGTEDYTVEQFRNCLGIFLSDDHRKAGEFTPLCYLYERGPYSKDLYIPNFGEYISDQVPSFMNLPRVAEKKKM